MKLPSFRHFQDRFLTANKEKWGKDTALCFTRFVFLMFRGPLASHDSNPYPNRSRIAQYNATKPLSDQANPVGRLRQKNPATKKGLRNSRGKKWIAKIPIQRFFSKSEILFPPNSRQILTRFSLNSWPILQEAAKLNLK